MKTILFIFLIAGLLISCKKSESNDSVSYSDPIDYSDLVIKSGYTCGWGSGTDSLLISKNIIKYVYYIPQQSQDPQIKVARAVSETEWGKIKNDINMNDFVKLTYHTCNVCVDGCDEWISIQDKDLLHKITFGYGYRIDTISRLQETLSRLRAEFKKQ
jgi:hypothetical protein